MLTGCYETNSWVKKLVVGMKLKICCFQRFCVAFGEVPNWRKAGPRKHLANRFGTFRILIHGYLRYFRENEEACVILY